MKKKICKFLMSSGLIMIATLSAHSQPGSLDPTFGNEGKIITAVGNYDEAGRSVAIRSDGRIVVAGYSSNTDSDYDFAVVFYNSDGTLDTAFSSDGKVTTDIGGLDDIGLSLALQNDRKIIVAGYSSNGIDNDFALVRYNSDGTLDTTFSSDGKVTTDIGSFDDTGHSVALQEDGKIVLAGFSYNGSDNDFAVLRYNRNGTLDETFGSGGKIMTDIGNADDKAYSVALQDDGKIVVAGYSLGQDEDFTVVRYNSDGTPDSTFSADGIVTTFVGAYGGEGYSAAIQDDGKIVVAGLSYNPIPFFGTVRTDVQLVRYKSDGSLDNYFGSGGKVTTAVNPDDDDGVISVAIQVDGRIVVAGYTPGDFGFDFAVLRYNLNGSLDNTFSSDGKAITDIGSFDDYANAVAIQPDGKIVVAGEYNFSHFAAARYNDSTVGIAENDADINSLIISPNPFTNEINIKGTKLNEQLIIYDVMGNEMMRQGSKDEETKINTERLLPGVYFLNYMEGHKMMSTKLEKI